MADIKSGQLWVRLVLETLLIKFPMCIFVKHTTHSSCLHFQSPSITSVNTLSAVLMDPAACKTTATLQVIDVRAEIKNKIY